MRLAVFAPLALLGVAALVQGAAATAGPAIAYGATGVATLAGGGWFVRYVLGRFDRLDASLGETREDVAAIMGALNIERPRARK